MPSRLLRKELRTQYSGMQMEKCDLHEYILHVDIIYFRNVKVIPATQKVITYEYYSGTSEM